jgi:selenocysteine-specific elongation factor
MDRLEALLAQPAPPRLREAAARAGCPDAGVRLLARRERIVLLEPDLAYATGAYRGLERQALDLASLRPLTPAAFRDATGTSRKYVMAILEDLDRRGILRRTDAGHVPGPRAATLAGPVGVATARP